MADGCCIDLTQRGYAFLYRPEVTNFCPGCSKANWLVGRHVAECAFCGAILPLSDRAATGASSFLPQREAAADGRRAFSSAWWKPKQLPVPSGTGAW